jgi:hypothetical protein
MAREEETVRHKTTAGLGNEGIRLCVASIRGCGETGVRKSRDAPRLHETHPATDRLDRPLLLEPGQSQRNLPV